MFKVTLRKYYIIKKLSFIYTTQTLHGVLAVGFIILHKVYTLENICTHTKTSRTATSPNFWGQFSLMLFIKN